MAADILRGKISKGPCFLEIQPTNSCSANCFFCSARPYRNGETLPWSELQKALKSGIDDGLRFIRLSGGGESLVYKSIQPLLEFCATKKMCIVDLTTNGTHLAPVASLLAEMPVDQVSVSLNEASALQYSKTMGCKPAVFDTVLDGILKWNSARERRAEDNRSELHLKFFLWRDNWESLPKMAELGRSLRASEIHISAISNLHPQQRISSVHLPGAKDLLENLIRADHPLDAPVLRFNLRGEGDLHQFAAEKMAAYAKNQTNPALDAPHNHARCEFCYMGWYGATIAATGRVFPCCNFVGNPEKEMGSLHQNALPTIWRGDKFWRFRSEIRHMVLLGGKSQYSRRLYPILEPVCLERWGCPFGYHLCSMEFYETVLQKLHGSARIEHSKAFVREHTHRLLRRTKHLLRKEPKA